MPAKNFIPKYSPTKLLQPIPYPVEILTKSPWNKFVKQNGYLALSKKIILKVYSQPAEIKELWEQFSPLNSVFDLWDVRTAFWEGYKFDPYFYTIQKQGRRGNEVLGILPLWFNSDQRTKDDTPESDARKYVWYGSNWPEDNVFFTTNEELIPLLLIVAPKPLELACIKPIPDYDFLSDLPGFTKEEEEKYFLDLSGTTTINDFLAKLKKKKRYNLKRDRKKILSLNPKITFNENLHLEDLFRLNIKRFREEFPDEPLEHSAFEDERRKNVFRSLITNAKNYQYRLISTVINGKVEAVEFGLVYKKTYIALNAGTDISRYSGIGVFSNLLVIEDALNLGCTKIDFLEGDNNWKHSWHLNHIYQYQFKK